MGNVAHHLSEQWPRHPRRLPTQPVANAAKPFPTSRGGWRGLAIGRADLTPVVRDDVHGGFLSTGRRTVDTDVVANEVFLDIWSDALIGIDQSSCPLPADLTVVNEVLFDFIRIDVGLLGGQAFVEGLVVPMPQQLRGLLRRRVSLVQRVVHTAVV